MDIRALLKRRQPQTEITDTVKHPRIDMVTNAAGPPSVDIDEIFATPERDDVDKEALDVEHQVTQVSFELLSL